MDGITNGRGGESHNNLSWGKRCGLHGVQREKKEKTGKKKQKKNQKKGDHEKEENGWEREASLSWAN